MCRRLFTIRRYLSCRTVVGPHCPADQITESFYLCDMAKTASTFSARDPQNTACYTVAFKSPADGLEYCLGGLEIEFDTEFEDISRACEAEACKTLKEMKKEWERRDVQKRKGLDAKEHSRGRRRSPRFGTNSQRNNPEEEVLTPDTGKRKNLETEIAQGSNSSTLDTSTLDPVSNTTWLFSEYTIRATELEDLGFMNRAQQMRKTNLSKVSENTKNSGNKPSEEKVPCISKELAIFRGYTGQGSSPSRISQKSRTFEYRFPKQINSRIVEAAFKGLPRHGLHSTERQR